MRIFLLFLFFGWQTLTRGQAASCVHSGGFHYLLDAYLGALGACDCKKSGILLTSFSACNKNPFELAFEDNFNGDSLDLGKWELSPSTQGNYAGGQSLELRTLNNVSISDGICHIIAKKEKIVGRLVNYKPEHEVLQDGLENLRTFDYTSSLLVTRSSFFHGKYEIRCRMPEGNGFWPAFWMFGGERYNEVDVFDSYGGPRELINCISHDPEGDGKPTGCNDSFKNFDLTQWHTFTCVFEPDQITFLVDNKPVNIIYRVLSAAREPVLCNDNISPGTYFQLESYPLEPMKIIFNMAITSKNGPAGSKPVDDTTPFPGSFDVDYIRFWKRTENYFDLFPNPAFEKINIRSSQSNITKLRVFDLNGLEVYNMLNSSPVVQLDFSAFTDGVYFIEINYDGGSHIKKIVKISK